MDGPSANLALSDIISNALPNDCKLENNSVSFFVVVFMGYSIFIGNDAYFLRILQVKL